MKSLAIAVVGVVGVVGLGSDTALAADEYQLAYSKQELANAQSVQALHARVLRTAQDFCPSYFEVRDLRRVRGCVQEVADDLVSKIDHPRLTSLHSGENRVRLAGSAAAVDDNS